MKNLSKYILHQYILPIIKNIRYFYFDGFSLSSYSQEGEDIILMRIFNGQSNGFYVDVGAHHPMRFSNTYKFYKLGWQGINIEPNPDTFNLLKRYRAKDINLNCGVAKEKSRLEYYMFDEPALNTFDREVSRSRISNNSKQIKTMHIDVLSLADILNNYIPPNQRIDFLTVDVEGMDLDVLKSNDWKKYRPNWVLVEQLNLEDIENLDFELHRYMKSLDYVLFSKTFNTLFYKNKES